MDSIKDEVGGEEESTSVSWDAEEEEVGGVSGSKDLLLM
ncbi:hypothetical protein SLEP1_g3004 [Rubroshorea leprosula]|uniref:Uncharacterized protein n=1 Tax=Rubroshorea leprosula TaxID=152421 RepID=A0AAV5HSP2_9ROSI|nr:hypothetical protein SLEP1_g3004 [Rubroshorea leprosula]